MARPRLNPMVSLDELRHEVDHLFESFLGASPSELIRGRKGPAVDVWEQGDLLLIQAEVPGVTMDQLDVYTTGQQLTLKGRRTTASTAATCLHRQELATGEFERTLALPFEVEPERIEAKLDNGLLTITIPKPELSTARRIRIQGVPGPAPQP